MPFESLTTENLDYLQRTGFVPSPVLDGAGLTSAPLSLRRLLRVDGIGQLDKDLPRTSKRAASLSADLLAGLYNYKVPLAFLVASGSGRASVSIGTWLSSGSDVGSIERNEKIIESALRGLYPAVMMTAQSPVIGDWALGGLALGMPTLKMPDDLDGALPIDRLLRALHGTRWAALILAQPVAESVVRDLRLLVVNEMRSVETISKHTGVPSPLAQHYVKLLEMHLERLTEALGAGAWRTAAYLLGDAKSYFRLASLWRGIFSGEESLPEPVRIWDRTDAPKLAAAWSMPDPSPDGDAPGHFRHMFHHQTFLTSKQLGAYVHVPNVETGGFAITHVPDFDVVTPVVEAKSFTLGNVVHRQDVSDVAYTVHPDKLTRHTFITGVTGSGKTNTILHVLRQATSAGVPWLVLEPAKTEYRVLLRSADIAGRLQIFTLGDETTSPFRLNPFEAPEGIPLAVHLDLIRAAFNASFGMWTPLPQVLETCIQSIYTDRGWDITAGSNPRLDSTSDRSAAFPTLSDLVRKVEEVVPRLGYEQRIAADIGAALRTRLNSLRAGGKGRMLDVRRSWPIEDLLTQPTILELEGMGDDDDKAFVMGLLMIRLAEIRRVQGDNESLRHLLVIEEAHRLLANPAGNRRQEGEADVRGKAVESFTNMLSEIRAYGQGVIVADQIPTKLAPDVIKNTNLKIAHRIVAGDDREVLGAAMVMNARQVKSIAAFPIGRAAVFTDGEDAPLLLQVPRAKGGSGTWPDNAEVRGHMQRVAAGQSADLRGTSDCDRRCEASLEGCSVARRLLEDPRVRRVFRRCVLSAVLTPGGMDRTWEQAIAIVEPRRPATVGQDTLFACLALHAASEMAHDRGRQAGWSYRQVAVVAKLVDDLITAKLEGCDSSEYSASLRQALLTIQGGGFGPFRACTEIWGSRPGPCFCRDPVAELVAERGFAERWTRARAIDDAVASDSRAAVWNVCQEAAHQLVEFPNEDHEPRLSAALARGARCVALCFAQQMFAAEEWAHPETQDKALGQLLEQSSHSHQSNADLNGEPAGKGTAWQTDQDN